jgi:hypothetical protein
MPRSASAKAVCWEARGVSDLQAALAARAGMAAFAHATRSWLEHERPGLAERLDQAERALKNLF